jgi:hypothetical protein
VEGEENQGLECIYGIGLGKGETLVWIWSNVFIGDFYV